MKPVPLPVLLSFAGGYIDTLGFLALSGLFTAHVTGNFVTLAAALVLGSAGIVAKLIALPVFMAVVALTRLAGRAIGARAFFALFAVKTGLLVVFAVLGVALSPFADADRPLAIATGMAAVAAMAIQNAIQRLHLPAAPPSTLMTGNTTQAVIDAVDLLTSAAAPDSRARLGRMGTALLAFAAGCAAAALLFAGFGRWAFLAPPLLALAGLPQASKVA